MKKILLLFISIFIITGCGGSGTQVDKSIVPKLGDTVIISGFDITLASYTLGKAIDPKEEFQDLIFLDLKIKNTGVEATKFNTNKIIVFNPNNVQIKYLTNSKYTSSITNLTSIRAGGETTGQLIFPFSGYGTYYVEFPGINGTVTAEIEVKEY